VVTRIVPEHLNTVDKVRDASHRWLVECRFTSGRA